MYLSGWKNIGAHLDRGVRTVQRWEHIGLPVHRPYSHKRTGVFAISEEVDEWAKSCAIGLPERNAVAMNQLNQAILQFRETRAATKKLVDQLRFRRLEHQRIVDMISRQSKPSALSTPTQAKAAKHF